MALTEIYRGSLGLLTDLYQLTMAYGYFRAGLADRLAAFHLTFRRNPFGGQYAIACGLSYAVEWLDRFRFEDADLQYLARLEGADGKPLFDNDFLGYLGRLKLRLDVDALNEGTVVFPHEPLLRVVGPLLQCQIVETGLLNMVNFQTLIATKATRVVRAARGQPILEFGLRRAQGIDGGLAASRAAFVGGCAATSNVLAGQRFDIPVRGTHAHSWVMSFDDELTSFQAYAEAMPNNCVFLVDTYDTLQGVRHAIQVGLQLRKQGYEMIGIRLDSGDLAELSKQARLLLDEAGLVDALIVASNDLNEQRIDELLRRGAQIGVWGVGTNLATAADQPALGGVYKLGALQDETGAWTYRLKLSEQPIKISTPGILQVRRYFNEDGFQHDAIYDQPSGIAEQPQLIDPSDGDALNLSANVEYEDLLQPVLGQGRRLGELPSATMARQRTLSQLAMLKDDVRRLDKPAAYCVGLESQLHELKTKMIADAAERVYHSRAEGLA